MGQTYVTRNSQDAVAAYRPVHERFAAMVANSGQLPGTFTAYDSYEDFLERGSALVGSPQGVTSVSRSPWRVPPGFRRTRPRCAHGRFRW